MSDHGGGHGAEHGGGHGGGGHGGGHGGGIEERDLAIGGLVVLSPEIARAAYKSVSSAFDVSSLFAHDKVVSSAVGSTSGVDVFPLFGYLTIGAIVSDMFKDAF